MILMISMKPLHIETSLNYFEEIPGLTRDKNYSHS